MFITMDDIKIHVNEFRNEMSKPYIFLLHGFAGSSEDWSDIFSMLSLNYNIIAIDLPGHGKSESPKNLQYYSQEFLTFIIDNVVNYYSKDQIILIGYSMGGRAAISYGVKYPKKIKKIILESSTAGIDNLREKEARIKKDDELAEFIRLNDIKSFADYWVNLPMFNSIKQDEDKYRKNYTSKLNCSRIGLSNALKGFSTGIMDNLFPYLETINYPVLLLAGAKDEKFKKINNKMNKLIKNSKYVVLEAGHNIHLEIPDKFADIVNKFLEA